jgi:hypothetical protein
VSPARDARRWRRASILIAAALSFHPGFAIAGG